MSPEKKGTKKKNYLKNCSSIFFSRIDNTPLVIFRILLGLLMFVESWGAIATGWVKKTFVDPEFTFHFFGFDFTQYLLVGERAYVFFIVMGIFGLLTMLGFYYRITSIILAFMWSCTYFGQKSHYNNHYYLMMLVLWIMAFLPAHRYLSYDVKRNSSLKQNWMPQYVSFLFIGQVWIVYTYAAIAKLYPGWMENRFLNIRMKQSANWFEYDLKWDAFARLLRNSEFQYFLTYTGFFFDLLIIPLFLFKKTRTYAFFGALSFHLFNSLTLHIGIFPYFALTFGLFFYSKEKIHSLFLPKKIFFQTQKLNTSKVKVSIRQKWVMFVVFSYLLIQFSLPLRHWFIKEDVLWTEEGHRLSWRMMLRAKSGTISFFTKLEDGPMEKVDVTQFLSKSQQATVVAKPDAIWAFSQKLEKYYKKENTCDKVEVFADSQVSINRGPYYDLLNDTVDLTQKKWKYFGHQDWILPSPENYYRRKKKKD